MVNYLKIEWWLAVAHGIFGGDEVTGVFMETHLHNTDRRKWIKNVPISCGEDPVSVMKQCLFTA